MDEVIFEFLAPYIDLTEEEKAILSEEKFIKSFKKGDILLSAGDTSRECFFVLKGCVYSYYVVEGELKVTEFFEEKQPITPVSYATKKPSAYYLECLEDCIISLGSEERTASIMKKIPRMAYLGAGIMQDELVNQRIKYDALLNFSPEERYQNLQDHAPGLLSRVPQYLIASYLGIKPESLSRIRKRMLKQS